LARGPASSPWHGLRRRLSSFRPSVTSGWGSSVTRALSSDQASGIRLFFRMMCFFKPNFGHHLYVTYRVRTDELILQFLFLKLPKHRFLKFSQIIMGNGFITKDKKAQKYYAQIPGNCVKYNSYLILDIFLLVLLTPRKFQFPHRCICKLAGGPLSAVRTMLGPKSPRHPPT